MARITGRHTITVAHVCPHCGDECGVRTLVEYEGTDYWDYTQAKCLGCSHAIEITPELERKFADGLDPIGAAREEREERTLQDVGL
jgi:hypothetical protein